MLLGELDGTCISFMLFMSKCLDFLIKRPWRCQHLNMALTWSYFCVFHKTLKYEILIDHFEIYLKLLIYHCYRPQRSCGQGNVFTGVCLSTGGRVSASVHAGMPCPPGTRETPGPGRPPRDQGDPSRDQGDPPGPGRHPHTPPPWDQGDTPHSRDQADTPPPGSRLQHTVYERPVRILLECILVQRSSSTTSTTIILI